MWLTQFNSLTGFQQRGKVPHEMSPDFGSALFLSWLQNMAQIPESQDGVLTSCSCFPWQLLQQTAAWLPASVMWMVSLQAEITTCSKPPLQALLYLQNKKLLGLEHGGDRDPAENHPLVQVVNTLCCWL